jgi:hypothetical protein
MKSLEKLGKSKFLNEKELSITLQTLNFEPKLARIRVSLRNGTQIYIRYNDYGEYSYSIIFSKMRLDRCRFDNYDDNWNVPTRPNHFHPRFVGEGFKSPMIGNPDKDIQQNFHC